MKKLGFLTTLMMIFTMCISHVYALGNLTPYFTNMNGVELTEEQYNNLLKGFSYDTINTMSEEMIDFLKYDTNIQKTSTTKYVKVSTRYVNNEAISTSEEEVSRKEFDNSPKKSIITKSLISPMFAAGDYVETNYKKITLDITFGASISTKYVTLTNV